MAEPPPPPRDPDDPRVPRDPAEDETIIADGWGPEDPVFVEQQEELVEPPPRRLPTIWPWLLALLVLVLAGLAAAYFLTRDDDEPASTSAATTAATTADTTTTTAAENVSVPDVVGTTSSQATQTLRDAGFEVNLVSVPSERAPGTVVAQSPAAGSEQPEGTSIRLNVAEAAATDTTGTTTTTPPATTGATTSQGTTTAPPPPRPATVPDVVGQELAEGARAFADEGLKASVAYVPSQEPLGRIVAQAQEPGTERKPGDTVQLNVSAGPDAATKTAVPRVTGQQLADGRSALDGAGFEVLALTLGDDAIDNEAEILSQSPAGGASIPQGALVLVYV
jgi:beta-lactam-binding protein with PASTA domain